MLVEGEGQTGCQLRGRGKQDVNRGEGQTGCQ